MKQAEEAKKVNKRKLGRNEGKAGKEREREKPHKNTPRGRYKKPEEGFAGPLFHAEVWPD